MFVGILNISPSKSEQHVQSHTRTLSRTHLFACNNGHGKIDCHLTCFGHELAFL